LAEERKLTKEEELSILTAGSTELERQVNLLVAKYKATVQDGRVVQLGVKVDSKNVGDIQNGLNKLIIDIQKKRILLIKKSDKEELLREARESLDAVKREVEDLPLGAFVPTKEVSDAVRESLGAKPASIPVEPSVSAAAKEKVVEAMKTIKPRFDIDLTPERKSSISTFASEIAKTLDDAVKRFEDGLAGVIKRFKASVQDKNGGFTKSSFTTIATEVTRADELAAQLQADGLADIFAERLRKQRKKIQDALLDVDTDEERAKLQEQLAEVERLEKDVLERIREKQAEYRRKRQEAEISAIEDDNERELAQRILSLERQRDEEIKKAKEVGIATTGIASKYTRQINELRKQFNEQSAQEGAASWATAFGEAASNLGNTLAKPYAQLATDQQAQTAQSLQSIEDEKRATLKRFLVQKSSADEYYTSIRDLNARQQVEMKRVQLPDVWGEFRNNALSAFRDIAEAQRVFIAQTLSSLAGYLKEQQTAQGDADALRQERDQAIDDGSMDRAKELNKQYLEQLNKRGQADKKSAETIIGVYSAVALAVGSSLSSAVAASENAGRAVVRTLFDTLQATVPIFTAMIFGVANASPANIATLGVWGATQFIGLTLAMQALVAAARAAAGYEFGGLVRGKEKLIRINERGEEFVVNSKATQKNLAALAMINRDNITVEEYVRRTSKVTAPRMDIPVVPLGEIQQYLDDKLSTRDQATAEMASELRALNQTVSDVKTVLTARRPVERQLVEVQASRDFNARARRKAISNMKRR
ncbi:MAG: hypothetical protein JNL32_11875, partial [Candidatus Kapabacteria bacterium]|nr:hypothetical protein [Candidatus Kapabacteria bacterium]